MKLLLTPLLFLLASCSQGASTHLEFPNDKPPLNKYFSMKVIVDEAWPLEIEVDADMPSHGHGMIVKPQVVKLNAGQWQVNGMKFHMPGDWEVYVELIGKDERRERQVIPVVVEPF